MSSRAREITRIIVSHHQTDADIGSREIDREHRDSGYLQIRYHFVVRRDGVVDPGRPIARASNPPDAVVIGVVGEETSAKQREGLHGLLRRINSRYPGLSVEGLD